MEVWLQGRTGKMDESTLDRKSSRRVSRGFIAKVAGTLRRAVRQRSTHES